MPSNLFARLYGDEPKAAEKDAPPPTVGVPEFRDDADIDSIYSKIAGGAVPPHSGLFEAMAPQLSKMINEAAASPQLPKEILNNQNDPSLLETVVANLASYAASQPNFKSLGHTLIAEQIAERGEDGIENPLERAEAFRPIYDEADKALKERSEDIIQGFANTSNDPLIAGRQEADLRSQISDIEKISGRLDTAYTQTIDKAQKDIEFREGVLDADKEQFLSDPENKDLLNQITESQESIDKDNARLKDVKEGNIPTREDPSQESEPGMLAAMAAARSVDCSWNQGVNNGYQNTPEYVIGELSCRAPKESQQQEAQR